MIYINQHQQEKSIKSDNQTTLYFDAKDEVHHIVLNFLSNENGDIEIITKDESHSYHIPKIINQYQELTLEIKMNNIKSITFNNIESNRLNTETEQPSLSKLKLSDLRLKKKY
ncbi:hypothetical protein [Candidatus Borreliella tachyglossi]|uniref:hypothetical protein n=1 Tax=Candidatus Borreliella tachyglossi TaxID=1964448 RepID=UPI0040422461